ncbi:MAG: XdhC family protein [Pseudomonadota bacterium]
MRHKNQVFERYRNWRERGAEMVFAIVIETLGSTYAKPGDFMLITTDGEFQGLLSGGCVEGDLALRAEQVGRDGGAAVIHYELGGEDDALWGMGAGCEGSLRILLQSFAEPDFSRVFDTLADRYAAGLDTRLAVSGTLPSVAWSLIDSMSGAAAFQWVESESTLDGRFKVTAAPHVLIAGGGADVMPLVDLFAALSWPVTVAEHREHYAMALEDRPCKVVLGPAGELSTRVDMVAFDAVIVMSHHLETDITYLSDIVRHHHWSYVGLLGPTHRKEKLIARVPAARELGGVLHGPVGLPLGGREPASIALSIVAHLHAVLAENGRLTGEPDQRVTRLG